MQSITDSYLDYDFLQQSLTELETNENTRGNIYEQIMQKEENAINLMHRIAEQKSNTQNIDSNVLNQSIREMARNSILQWMSMYNDIVQTKNYDIVHVFYNQDRKIYTGILLVLISIVLFFVEISE